MTKSVVQFHADPRELCDFLADVAKAEQYFITGRWKPGVLATGPRGCFPSVPGEGLPLEVYVTKKFPAPAGQAAGQGFLRANPDALSAHIGQLSGDGLDESFMGFMTDDADLLGAWSNVLRRFKKRTQEGAWAVSTVSGRRGPASSHRHTAAARNLARNGVKMWALGRKTLLELPGD